MERYLHKASSCLYLLTWKSTSVRIERFFFILKVSVGCLKHRNHRQTNTWLTNHNLGIMLFPGIRRNYRSLLNRVHRSRKPVSIMEYATDSVTNNIGNTLSSLLWKGTTVGCGILAVCIGILYVKQESLLYFPGETSTCVSTQLSG